MMTAGGTWRARLLDGVALGTLACLSCRARETAPVPVHATESALVVDAASAAPPPASPIVRLHAEGPSGSVAITICTTSSEKSLALAITPKGGATYRVVLHGAEATTRDADVRLVDVDHDGLPDIVIGGAARKAPAVATVYLAPATPSPDCSAWSEIDRASEGFIVHAQTLDEAVTALAAIPRRPVTDAEVCAFLDATKRNAFETYAYEGSSGAIESRIDGTGSLLTCRAKVPDGPGFLHPAFECDAARPYCRFGLASGDTWVPPTERRYWFDPVAGKVTIVAVPQM